MNLAPPHFNDQKPTKHLKLDLDLKPKPNHNDHDSHSDDDHDHEENNKETNQDDKPKRVSLCNLYMAKQKSHT